MKVCQLTEDMCPGSTDFKVAGEGTMAFEERDYRISFVWRLLQQEGRHTGQDEG